MKPSPTIDLAAVAQRARRRYVECVAGMSSAPPWWTAVIVTASSQRQAESQRWEIQRRLERGRIPRGAKYLVAPDVRDQRIGSGGATINALRELMVQSLFRANGEAWSGSLEEWWASQRVLIIHSGGDSRRLPQYSLSGKLFSALPVKTPWGEISTVFDETLALSSSWVERLPAGLVVGSGDVLLTFDATGLDWSRPGICGVAMRQPAELGTRHGVYIADEQGRVYSFLQKPSLAELRAAGGILEGDEVALDIGLLRFAPESAARLSGLAGAQQQDGKLVLGPGILEAENGQLPSIDAYEHVTKTLTGQWTPGKEDPPALHALAEALKGTMLWCSTVQGDFTHVGTTPLFRQLMTEESEFSRLYAAQQRLRPPQQPGLRSAGVVIESVLAGGGELGAGAVAIECNLSSRVRAASGAVLHGLEDLPGTVEIPEDTVVHQVPVALPGGRQGVVIRVYGVEDDPKAPAAGWKATWLGHSMLETLRGFGMDLAKVWPGQPAEEWTLWNANLFPVSNVTEAWHCARWLMGLSPDFPIERWSELPRLSLATSAQWADGAALQAAHMRRLTDSWQNLTVSLAVSGADVRPLLAYAPGVASLAETGRRLQAQASGLGKESGTESAHRYYVAGLFFANAGLAEEADQAREAAFDMVRRVVDTGAPPAGPAPAARWRFESVTAQAPARFDMGGGWSDTPPFCLDWGGTVLNIAVALDGAYPIATTVRRIPELLIRCNCGEDGSTVEYRDCGGILSPASAGDPFAVPRTALQMSGLFGGSEHLDEILGRMGGGIEIRTAVDLPMGSGLGASSILAATTLRALHEMLGVTPDNQRLSDEVMRLEQIMTTGGGWQDQAGGIFPGAKLVVSGPGLQQRLRVEPLAWTAERAAEFESLMVLHYTGIRRIARGLLQQVVGGYLARETATVQVLHSIKTLAMEMAHAMREGEWDHLGELLDRHWELNQVLDPNTTNAPINTLLGAVRPYIRGVKLAGAGGGGFLMLLARSQTAAGELRHFLREQEAGSQGRVYEWRIADEGLRVARVGQARQHSA